MAQCFACRAELAVHAHRCSECGAHLRRAMVRSDAERRRARVCHLLTLPGMLVFVLSFPAIGLFALVPLNLIFPLVYRWRNPDSRAIRTHASEALNFQVLWSATVTILWLLVVLATPRYDEPLGTTILYYVPEQSQVVELPRSGHDATPRLGELETDGEEEDDESFWALATMAFWMLSLVWVGGITLSAFLAYDLGNGGNGRYPLHIPIFRSG